MTDDDNEIRRLSIDLTTRQHRELKAHAVKANLSMRELVLQVLQKEGVLGRSKKRGP